MSKYYKENYCVIHGKWPHVRYVDFDNFEEAWKYFTECKDAGYADVILMDTSERTPEHPAADKYGKYAKHLRIA